MREQATDRAMTLGEELRASDGVREGIARIVGELTSRQERIEGVRPATDPGLKQSFDQFMELAAAVRGRPLLYPYVGSGIGNGPYVELMDGSVKLDLITGIGVHFFGHSDPDLVATALEASTGDIGMQGHLIANEEAFRFAEVLVHEARRGSRLEHAFLTNGGALANENALKVCYQKHGGGPRVLAFSHCFMGRTTTMAQIGDSAGGRQGLPLNMMVDYVPFYDHVAARRMSAGEVSGSTRYIDMACWHLRQYIERYPGQHACFIFELVQGEGGFNTALPDFHRELMTICRENGIAVWDDEVQTFGRTERMFCFEALGVGEYVDVCSIGKMSQVCAAMYVPEYNPRPGLLSGTFLGSTAPLRVGRRMLERLRDGDYYGPDGSIARHHALFRKKVEELAARRPDLFPKTDEVHELAGGYGGMMRMTPFGGRKEPILQACRALFDDGLIAFYCGHGPYHLRMLPPLGVMREEHWDVAFGLLEAGLSKVASSS